MRPRVVAGSLAALVAVTAGGFAATEWTGRADREPAGRQTALPPATATVARGDLVSATSVDGVLGYNRKKRINAGATGTVTWLPGSGSKIGRDGRLYALDGEDIRLMYGTEPMYRNLKKGDEGTDVQQLKANLIALGLGGGITEDEEFTRGTAEAVARWQKAHGLKETGTTGPGQIAFAPGPVRVQSADVTTGDRAAPGGPVLTTTGSERVVRLKVKVSEAALVARGGKVSVGLPDGTVTTGTVSSVGTTATTGDDPNDKTPRIDVTVTFDDPGKVGGIDKSPATVKLTGRTREDVLSVPVSALLALADGSFGVQVVEDGRTREARVRLGMFAQGRVEVSGDGLRAGMKVGVPRT